MCEREEGYLCQGIASPLFEEIDHTILGHLIGQFVQIRIAEHSVHRQNGDIFKIIIEEKLKKIK